MQNEAGTAEFAGEPANNRHEGSLAGLVAGLGTAAAGATGSSVDDVFEAAFRSSPVALALARDPHCAVVLRNAAMNRIMPPSLDWRGWRLPDGSAPPLFERGIAVPLEQQPLRLAAFRGEPTDGREIELRWFGCEPVFFRVSAVPLRDAAGALCGAVAAAVDITGERHAGRSQGVPLARAPQSRAKDELLGLLGHELRNPLNAIATAVEVLNRADPGAPEAQSARRIIGRQTRRLADLIGELSDVGRALADGPELVRRPVELGALLEQCTARAQSTAAPRGQRLEARLAAIRIDADAARLADAIDRLLQHALREAADGRVIAVRLHGEGGDAIIAVGDSETLAAADPPRPAFGHGPAAGDGLGIALAPVRHVVELHGGRVEVRRREPAAGGTVFQLRLPALAADPESRAGATAARLRPLDAPNAPAGDIS